MPKVRKISVKVSSPKNYVSGKVLEQIKPACQDGRFWVQKYQPKKFWRFRRRVFCKWLLFAYFLFILNRFFPSLKFFTPLSRNLMK